MSQSEENSNTRFTNLTRGQYIFRFGVLGWGVPTAVLFALVQWYLQAGGFLAHLIPALILFPLGGIAWGYFMYRFLVRKHRVATATGGHNTR